MWLLLPWHPQPPFPELVSPSLCSSAHHYTLLLLCVYLPRPPIRLKMCKSGMYCQNFSELSVLAGPWHIVEASYDKEMNVWSDRGLQTNSHCQGHSQWTFSQTGSHETLLLRNINRSPGLKSSMIKNVENVVYFISQKFTIFIRTLKFLLYFSINTLYYLCFFYFWGILCVCTQYLLELIPGNNTSCTTGFYSKLRNEAGMRLSPWLLRSFCKGWANAVRPNRKKKGRKKESAIAQQDKNDYFADNMNQLQKDKKINWESLFNNKKCKWG